MEEFLKKIENSPKVTQMREHDLIEQKRAHVDELSRVMERQLAHLKKEAKPVPITEQSLSRTINCGHKKLVLDFWNVLDELTNEIYLNCPTWL